MKFVEFMLSIVFTHVSLNQWTKNHVNVVNDQNVPQSDNIPSCIVIDHIKRRIWPSKISTLETTTSNMKTIYFALVLFAYVALGKIYSSGSLLNLLLHEKSIPWLVMLYTWVMFSGTSLECYNCDNCDVATNITDHMPCTGGKMRVPPMTQKCVTLIYTSEFNNRDSVQKLKFSQLFFRWQHFNKRLYWG